MQTYMLDLETLLYLLEESGQNGILSTDLLSGVPNVRGRCRARIELRSGKVAACQLESANGGILVAGNQALQALSNLGVQEWQLVENQLREQMSPAQISSTEREQPEQFTGSVAPVVPFSMSPATASEMSPYERSRRKPLSLSSIPQRMAFVDRVALEQLPRRHRRVLSLVDGSRSVERIAFLLSPLFEAQNNQQLWDILQDLEAMGMIRSG